MASHRHILRAGLYLIGILLFVGALLQPSVSHAQIPSNITSDGTMGTIVSQAGNVFNINGGTIVGGTNLFQSFGFFTVGTGAIASFNGPNTIANILGRVTGGQQSIIDGMLRSTILGANLFLLNPAGVMFGPNASLDVSGSFHVSTADYLRFADGAKFFANLAQNSVLTSAPVAAFGFLGPAPAPISIQGSFLQVPEGQTLSVVGGDIQVTGATLQAPSGRVHIASVASAGEVGLVTPGGAPALDVSSFSSLGQIDISGGSLIDASDVSGIGGGTVVIRGGRLTVDGSSILASTLGDVDGAPVGIDIQVAGDMALTNSAAVATFTLGAGRAGDLSVNVGTLTVTGGSALGSLSFAGGPGGNVTVTATQSVTLSGRDIFGTPSTIISETDSSGDGGRVTVSAPSLTISDGASIQSNTLVDGRGGDIAVQVGSLSITGGGQIASTAGSIGPGGNISVAATGSAVISGGDNFGPSGITSTVSPSCFQCTGRIGDISMNVGNLTLADGALIQSGSIFADAPVGNVTVAAPGSIAISGGAGISSQAFSQDAGPVTISAPAVTMNDGFINTSTVGDGRGGDISLNVGTLSLTGGAQIASSSSLAASGAGGSVTVNASDSISISGTSSTGTPVTPFLTDPSSGLFSTASSGGTGNAGQIAVSAQTLTVSDGGKISVSSAGAGQAGNISLNVNNLNLTTGGGLFSNAEASGAGGNISVQAAQVQLTNGGIISATSSGTGNAGNVAMVVRDTFDMQDSIVTTQAVQADGGNILLTVGSLVHLVDSKITTSVGTGQGTGGNITIDPLFVVLDRSEIRADAFGGPGGNILILADVFLTQDSILSASSALSTPGTINIEARFTNLSSSVARLPGDTLQAAALLRASCATRLSGGKLSSLVVAGREGVPPDPSGVLPSPLLAEIQAQAPVSGGEGDGWEGFARFAWLWPNHECSAFTLR